jgi:quercetin dioxygenase-like cupin family protein
MEFVEQQPSGKAPAEWFTGNVRLDVVVAGREPSRMRADLVRFTPGARTNRHRHAVGQTRHP